MTSAMMDNKKINGTFLLDRFCFFDNLKAIYPKIKAANAGINAILKKGKVDRTTARMAEIIPKMVNKFFILLIF